MLDLSDDVNGPQKALVQGDSCVRHKVNVADIDRDVYVGRSLGHRDFSKLDCRDKPSIFDAHKRNLSRPVKAPACGITIRFE